MRRPRPSALTISRRRLLSSAVALSLARPRPVAAQSPVKVGEINSYSGIGAPFTLPYRQAVEMAVDELNGRGGVSGRRVEFLFRDDKGQPAEAVKHAQELVAGERVRLLAGGFLSNVGLAVSDWARQHRVMYVAAEPLTEALTWSRGHPYVVRVRPNTYEQGRMLAERAAELTHARWATIGPNYEYGRRAWETFRDRLRELRPGIEVVGEHWPPLGKLEAGPYVTAILAQQPQALYVSLFGSDWIAFVREATKRGLFQKMFVVGILLGEPEYIDPLKTEAPEGMLVTGYPWYDIEAPAHRRFVEQFTRRTGREPRLGSLVGYITVLSIAEALRRAGPDADADRLSAAFRGLTVATPIGSITFRAADGQSTMGAWVGFTRLDPKRGVGIMVDHQYVPGEKVLPSDDEVRRLRAAQ
jgi:branched-chain amino acid transport system substrate-binding protein